MMHEPDSVDVATLLGPANVPAVLHEPLPKDEAGLPSWSRLHHALLAIDHLIAAGMVGHARTVVAEAKAIVAAGRPREAEVVAMRPRSGR